MSDAGAAEMAARLREQAARLTAAAAAAANASCEASSNPGRPSEVSVTATGAGRVTKVYIGPQAMRTGAATLAPTLTRLLTEALTGARRSAAETVAEAAGTGPYQPAAAFPADEAERSAADLAAELSADVVSATSPDRKVGVTASGAAEITGVTFGATALRGFDNLTLGEQVAAAANAALAAVAERRRQRLGLAADTERPATNDLDARLAAFGRRMDGLLDELDQAGRRISGLE